MPTFLRQLRVDWPGVSEKPSTEALRIARLQSSPPAREAGALPPGTLGRVCLKELMEEQGRTAGYDPSVDSCVWVGPGSEGGDVGAAATASRPASAVLVLSPVTEDLLSLLAGCRRLCRLVPRAAPRPG